MAQQAEPELLGPQHGLRVRQLEAEHDNLRAALNWRGTAPGRAEQQLELAGAVWRFWDARGNIVEGQRFLEGALEQGKAAAPAVRAKGYAGLGTMAWLRSDHAQAVAGHEQALVLNREIEDTYGIALALVNIGGAWLYQDQLDRALAYFEESLALARQLEDHHLLTLTLTGLGELARYRGDSERAQKLYQEGARRQPQMGMCFKLACRSTIWDWLPRCKGILRAPSNCIKKVWSCIAR